MAANALKTINKIARTLKREHPGMKHSSAIKQASAIYRRDHDKKSAKRTPAKKRRVGSTKPKTSVGTDRVDNKRVHVTIGGMTIAKARKYLKDEAEEKLRWALLHRDQGKNKAEKRKYAKEVVKFRRKLNLAKSL